MAKRSTGAGSGRAAVALAVALCACGRDEPGPALSADAGPPPQVSLAGLRGLRTRSRVVFEGLPGLPHVLTTVYAFPARGLWRLEPEDDRRAQRRISYRLGDELYELLPGASTSVPLTGVAADEAALRMELRLAAMLWPDGHPWTPGADPDRVRVGDLGSLEALGASTAAGAPTELRALRPDGSELERLEAIEWSEPRDGRAWPARWTLATPQGVVWREELTEVGAAGIYADLYFVPPDRLEADEAARESSFDPGVVQQVVIPARTVRRFELPEGSSWAASLEAARALRERWGREQRLEPRVELELGSGARPRAVGLRLEGDPPAPLPEGWERRGTTVGASQLLSGPERASAGLVARLRESLPEPERADRPYLLVDPAADAAGSAQLVVPVLPDR